MDSTRNRMITVALLVCLFSVGMAGLLNFFKYRSTAEHQVKQRLTVLGNAIENGIQKSLALGMHFSELGGLAAILERERATDDIILGIEIFDTDGHLLYAAGPPRKQAAMPAEWLDAARRAGHGDWFVEADDDTVSGISIENNFNLTIGYLAVRYDGAWLRADATSMAIRLAGVALVIFAIAGTLASLLLIAVMRQFGRQVGAVEQALRAEGDAASASAVAKGPFANAMPRLFETVLTTEAQLAALGAQLALEPSR